MKKLITGLLCFALIIVGAIGLVACGNETKSFITLPKEAVIVNIEGGTATFQNNDDLKLSRDNNNYKVTGTASTFDANGVKYYSSSDATVSDKYIVLHLDLKENDTYTVGYVKKADKDKALKDNTDKQYSKTITNDDGFLILNITGGTRDECGYLRIETDTNAYIIDFTDLVAAE